MLHFFAKRIQDIQEAKRDERGFTLIELLVVVIIIGILAAIAIPAFLSQRERAQNAAAESDLRNAAAAATSCYSANNGSYTAPDTCDEAELAANHGFNETDDVNVTVDAPTADAWTASSVHTNSSPTSYTYDSDEGKVTESP